MFALTARTTHSEDQVAATEAAMQQQQAQPLQPVKPYRTFITVQRYTVENNGNPNQPVSNVRLEMTFPNGAQAQLPESGDFWPVGNGQSQEINRTYEIPWAYIQNDGFRFSVQMIRKGTKILPCEFDIVTLSQFNRGYICRTDVAYQANKGMSEDKLDKEGIQIRVFTDKNSTPKDIPQDAIALR
jgi:hypothetical protein